MQKGLNRKMMHFYAIVEDGQTKMKKLTELLRKQQLKGQIIVFCSVS